MKLLKSFNSMDINNNNSNNNSNNNMKTLYKVKTNDTKVIFVERDVVLKIPVLKDLIETIPDDENFTTSIPLSNIDSETLNDIIHLIQVENSTASPSPLSQKSFDDLVRLVNGANYLGIDEIVDAICDHMIPHLEKMSQEEVNTKLG